MLRNGQSDDMIVFTSCLSGGRGAEQYPVLFLLCVDTIGVYSDIPFCPSEFMFFLW